ncbi:Methyltransferase type 11 [Alicyclobacillus hesperidum URH17-3-68]|uniref:class I SAM-dependent methyltransferase n=1 Tax=Alicyclobacillus hesperidum TaxID=89784 RepID=UPI000281C2F7|nr:methyltransferase domain-containing protein [Alicyclobacillus hesperidum]EJY54900.1 Methyltransferase type 11 [Alicyclobacillus hesperidum URH17-3-68]
MKPLAERFQAIDATWSSYAHQNNIPHRWLLEQTLHTAPIRRALLPALGIQENMTVLDLGTGYGALAFEIAASWKIALNALDHDVASIHSAKKMLSDIEDMQGLHPQSRIIFQVGDAYQLPYEDRSFDYVISRFVFQHLRNPQLVMQEIHRVLKPGGLVCIIDIDDQLSLSYPEHPTAFSRLREAFCKLQVLNGGDRHIGRKIPLIMHECGLEVIRTLILPQAQFSLVSGEGPATKLAIQQFRDHQEAIIKHGLLTASEFENYLLSLQESRENWVYALNEELITIARRR